MKKYVQGCILFLLFVLGQRSSAQTLNAAEYFFDTDPGAGKGSPVAITAGTSVNMIANIPTGNLSPGFHQLFIRFKDNANKWGIAEQRAFYVDAVIAPPLPTITGAEYFFDTDPGAGKAKPIAVTAGTLVNATMNIPTDNLPPGFHQLFIRFKDNLNKWSLAEQRVFYIDNALNNIKAPLVAAEYFFMQDPGVGKGIAFPITKADSLNKLVNIIVPPLALGKQFLNIRTMDSLGKWSIAERREIKIVCKPNLGKDTTIYTCGNTDISNLYDYKNYASWQWNIPNPSSVGAGTYKLTATSSLGCSDTAFVTVNANLAPPTTTPSGNVSIYPGSTVTINVNRTYNSYLWSTGATTSSITTGTAGSYSVTVTNANGCSGTSAPVNVTVVTCTKPTITAGGSTTNVCPGKTVKLTSSASSSYLWSTGATTKAITVSAAGSYTVTTAGGCTSDPVVVTYTGCADPTGLAVGSITATSAVLSWTGLPCATKYTVQYRIVGTTGWTKVITTTPSLPVTALTAGTQYQWNVTAVCGGGVKSAKITGPKFTTASAILSAKVENMKAGKFNATLFPNPAKDRAALQLSGAKDKVFVMITDITGKPLWQSGGINSAQVQLPVEKFSNGTYLVHITCGAESKTIKLLKTK